MTLMTCTLCSATTSAVAGRHGVGIDQGSASDASLIALRQPVQLGLNRSISEGEIDTEQEPGASTATRSS